MIRPLAAPLPSALRSPARRPPARWRVALISALLASSAPPVRAEDPIPPEAPEPRIAPAPFAPVMRTVGQAVINWTTLTIETQARSDRTMGAWMDRRVQEQDALDRVGPSLEALARAVPIRRDEPLDAVVPGDDLLAARLEDGLRGWEVAETRYHEGGGVEMTARLNLLRWLAPLLDKKVGPSSEAMPEGGATGLLIDARGLPFTPSVVPELRAADLRVLMSLEMLGKDNGKYPIPVVYVSDPADPRAATRVGPTPALLRPTGGEAGVLVLGPTLPLAETDLALLVAARRVVIVADPTN